MFDARNRLSHEIAREVEKHFPDKVFQSVIPRNVRLSESPSHGLSVIEYDPKSAGAEAYQNLATELVARLKGGASTPEETADAPARRSWSCGRSLPATMSEVSDDSETLGRGLDALIERVLAIARQVRAVRRP